MSISELCNDFKNKIKISKKKTKINLFLELSGFSEQNPDNFKIVNTNSFVGDFKPLSLGNGGSWCRKSAWKKYKVATRKNNGTINYLWYVSEDERERINEIFKQFPCEKGNHIQFIGIFGIKENIDKSRPIRKDIVSVLKKRKKCCVCGRKSDLVCDHKNDLYNDPKVLSTKTQTIDDFQLLCNQCNLQKRQISIETKKTGKRYGATNIPMLKSLGIDFIEGDENFDINDINAMKGTFWYDPIEFMKNILIPKNE